MGAPIRPTHTGASGSPALVWDAYRWREILKADGETYCGCNTRDPTTPEREALEAQTRAREALQGAPDEEMPALEEEVPELEDFMSSVLSFMESKLLLIQRFGPLVR